MGIDIQIFRFLNEIAAINAAVRYLSVFLAQWLIWVLATGAALVIIVTVTGSARYRALAQMSGALILAFVFKAAINAVWWKPRPFVTFKDAHLLIQKAATSPAFPSGHAAAAFAIAFSLFFVHRGWGVLAIILAVLVGLGRVLVGVHYPLDVVGGAAVGFLSAITVNLFASKLIREKINAKVQISNAKSSSKSK